MISRPPAILFASCVFLASACDRTPTVAPDATVTPPSTEGHVFGTEAELLALITKRVDEGMATGIVLGVREADGTRKIVAYGEAGPGALPLGPKSVFEIGSISKVFTGIVLAEMAQAGELALEDPIAKHAHEGVTIPSHGDLPIRLVDLSTHTSGLPRLPTNITPKDPSNPYADYTVDQLHEFLSGYTLERDVGEKQEYSNLGTGLLGHILAAVQGADWGTTVNTRILSPLKMTMSGVALTPEMKKHFVRGHHDGEVVSNWDLPTLAGAGALRSNAQDMLTFLEANLERGGTSLHAAMRTSHQPRVDAGPDMKVGLNWFTRTSGTHQLVWHNGGTGGYRSFVGFDVERQISVVVLENSGHGPDDIGFHLLDNSLELAKPPREHHAIEMSIDKLGDYVGIYELAPSLRIHITLNDGVLQSQPTGQGISPIFPEAEDEFFFKVVDAQFTFDRGTDGKITNLVLHQNGAHQPARRLEGEAAELAIIELVGKQRKEVAVDAKVLKRYVGVYEMSPVFRLTVTLEDGVLYMQATGQPKFEIYAESKREFFLKVVDAQITFVRVKKSGKIKELVLHQGGLDQVAKKVE